MPNFSRWDYLCFAVLFGGFALLITQGMWNLVRLVRFFEWLFGIGG